MAATAATWSPANAQCRLCDKPTTSPQQNEGADSIQLEIETSLNFDRLVLSGGGDGAAVVRPDGSTAAEGALTGVSARAMVGTAVVHGQAGRTVRVELPRRIDLYSLSGGRIAFDDVVSDLPSLPKLDSTGTLTFRFGGRVRITGDSDGEYRGDLPITVEYQ
ncbi:MAG TPA: DUF4402 domain-containing protein [Sphingomicrobium sp.]|nr:DUF4402 domain-containing protein [Sphingomicrobium sp.]